MMTVNEANQQSLLLLYKLWRFLLICLSLFCCYPYESKSNSGRTSSLGDIQKTVKVFASIQRENVSIWIKIQIVGKFALKIHEITIAANKFVINIITCNRRVFGARTTGVSEAKCILHLLTPEQNTIFYFSMIVIDFCQKFLLHQIGIVITIQLFSFFLQHDFDIYQLIAIL